VRIGGGRASERHSRWRLAERHGVVVEHAEHGGGRDAGRAAAAAAPSPSWGRARGGGSAPPHGAGGCSRWLR
jgi:hypothetical protein